MTVLRADERAGGQALLLSCDRLSIEAVAALGQASAELGLPVVLVIAEMTESGLLTAVECRVVAILHRSAITAERLVLSVRAAVNGGGVMPPNLIGELLKHIER